MSTLPEKAIAPAQAASPAKLTHLLYLHGFRSSPRSFKALATQAWFARHAPQVKVHVPALPISPKQAAQHMDALVRAWPRHSMAVMGSSLGGFYANWVAARYGCPAVFLNPAVNPARDLERYIGEVSSWHDPTEKMYFQPEYIGELRALETPASHRPAAAQMALIAKGDEVLDWREMTAHFPHARQIVLEGGDHALTGIFEQYLPELARFLCNMGAPSSDNPQRTQA